MFWLPLTAAQLAKLYVDLCALDCPSFLLLQEKSKKRHKSSKEKKSRR